MPSSDWCLSLNKCYSVKYKMLKFSTLSTTLALLILLGVVGGCQKTTDPEPADSDYFPLQTGDSWVYQVTQETYSLTNPVAKQRFQIQQKIGSSFNRNGQVYFQIEESIRKTDQSAWQIRAFRTVYKTLSEVVSQTDNVPALTLVFPISEPTSWNINTYNARPDTLLQYKDSGRSITLGKRTFEQTVSVVGANDSTLVGQEKYRRVYAPTIGLIYREDASLAFCQSSPDCIGKGIIASGTKQTWELVSTNRQP